MASRFLILYEGAMRLLRPSSLTLDPDGYADVHAKTADSAPPSGAAGGDLAGSYPAPDLLAIHAGLSGGSASAVPALTVDTKGRTLTLTPTAIQITEAQVTNLSTDLSARVLKAGDTMTGNLRVNAAIGIGADPTEELDVTAPAAGTAVVRVRGNGEVGGVQGMDLYANTTGHGIWGYGSRNVILGAGAAERVRVLPNTSGVALVTSGSDQFVGGTATNASVGMLAGSTFVAAASSGACFVMRGNTYSTNPNQRGNIYFIAGDPSAPGSTEGAVHFLTGADLFRMSIDRTGQVGIGTTSPTALLHVTGTCKLDTSVAIGGGTAITQVKVYTPTLTPALIAASGVAEQTFTVTGLSTSDTVTVSGPAATADTALVHARVSAVDTLALTWVTMAAGLTPAAGVYRILATRS